jgi:hypothetical protein
MTLFISSLVGLPWGAGFAAVAAGLPSVTCLVSSDQGLLENGAPNPRSVGHEGHPLSAHSDTLSPAITIGMSEEALPE